MSEVFFYHLDGERAEDILPELLQRGLTRGLKMAVEVPDKERLLSLSQKLWSLEDVAFVPHGYDGEPYLERQDICLAADGANPNNASFRFYFGGAVPNAQQAYERISVVFDGGDETEVASARDMWRQFKTAGRNVKYWKKDDSGRWVDMAQTRNEQ